MKITRLTATIAPLFLLAACGSGGSGSNSGGGTAGGGGGGVPTNSAPTFTSGTSFNFEEQFILAAPETIVQLAASDADGDALTFGISGTKDGGLFIFNAQEGALAFENAPSFETPRDADGDNIYEVDVTVSDGTASVTQTVRVEVTNSLEGLTVTRLVSNLGNGAGGFGSGVIHYVDETNELLAVMRDGRVFRINASTGAIISSALSGVTGASDTELLGIAVDGLDFRDNNFFVLTRTSSTILVLHYVNALTGDSRILWLVQPGGAVSASLGLRGNNPLIAISDGGMPSLAQDRNDIRGNLLMMIGSGDPTDQASFSVTPSTVGIGLRDPRLFSSTNLAASSVIDRGELFNEFNTADFAISQSNANFEWPGFDGIAQGSFTGTLTGERITPVATQERVQGGPGPWVAGSDSLQGQGWFGLLVVSDSLGNIFTLGTPNANGEPVENRNLDFRTAGLGNRPIVSMDDGDFDVGNANPIYMLDDEGSIFAVDLTP